MEYILKYPELNVSWYQVLIESIERWWMQKAIKNFEENDFLIN